ncbi:hypothetical protein DFH06DRAFT_1447145 [Mycena polygramma]|nr:hypothetical protein DFH06DRAFT_1447145 [Mycena polygramma]
METDSRASIPNSLEMAANAVCSLPPSLSTDTAELASRRKGNDAAVDAERPEPSRVEGQKMDMAVESRILAPSSLGHLALKEHDDVICQSILCGQPLSANLRISRQRPVTVTSNYHIQEPIHSSSLGGGGFIILAWSKCLNNEFTEDKQASNVRVVILSYTYKMPTEHTPFQGAGPPVITSCAPDHERSWCTNVREEGPSSPDGNNFPGIHQSQ